MSYISKLAIQMSLLFVLMLAAVVVSNWSNKMLDSMDANLLYGSLNCSGALNANPCSSSSGSKGLADRGSSESASQAPNKIMNL